MSTSKKKIFISAYACEPNLGSEIGVGWHWVLEMSKNFELWVLTRKSNQHTIEPWIAEHPEYNNIHFLYFDLPKWARFWKKGLRGVRTYYNIWQACTNRIVKRTMQENDIKIFHHLTYGNVLWKVSPYGQKQFFVWGPVGGLETIPSDYSNHYNSKWKLIEFVRRIVVKMLPLNIGFYKRCANANLILCKTEKTINAIPAKRRDKAVLFTDVAVEKLQYITSTEKSELSQTVNYVAVGHLDPWRGFDVLIESFAIALKQKSNLRLTIIGSGGDKERLEEIIHRNKVGEYVDLKGKVSREEYYNLMKQSDVVVNSSLKEGAVTVSFDSMSMGKPLICIDTTGYTRYFLDDYAIVLPECNREEMIENLAGSIVRLEDQNLRLQLGTNALQAGSQFTWENRGVDIYKTIIASYERR